MTTAVIKPFDPHAAWPEPDPRLLNGGVRPAPPLPGLCFRSLEAYIRALAKSKGAPADYVALALMTGAAGAIGAARSAQPRPGWTAPTALWGLAVGAPSSGKSQPVVLAQNALLAVERAEAPDHEAQLVDFTTRKQVAELTEAVWKEASKKALKAGARPAPRPEEADCPEQPRRPRLVVGDPTPEAMAKLFATNPRGLILCRDEIAAWLGNFGKYGGEGDAAYYLSTFDGTATPVDRVKDGGTVPAERALLSVLGGVQPEKLHEMLFSDRADDGFISRFLVVWPDPVPVAWEVPIVDERWVESLLHRLRALQMASDHEGRTVPVLMPFSDGARAVFAEWYVENVGKARAGCGLIAGFRGKANGVVARIALVLDLLEWAAQDTGAEAPGEVSEEGVSSAILLFEDYLLPMAERVYGDAASSPAESNAVALLKEAVRREARVINAREVRRSWRVPGLSQAEQVRSALAHLEEADCVKRPEASDGPGRPREDWLLNPRLLAVRS